MKSMSALREIGDVAKEAIEKEIRGGLRQLNRSDMQISQAATFALKKLENEQKQEGVPAYFPPPTRSLNALGDFVSQPLVPTGSVGAITPSTTGINIARTFWTSASNQPVPPQVDQRTLEHQPIDAADRERLTAKLGGQAFKKVNQFRHRDGMCHTDTTLMALELAGKAASRIGSGLSVSASATGGFQLAKAALGATSNAWLPWTELGARNTQLYDIDQLMIYGMPENSACVVLHALSGLLDPQSKQADAIEPYLASGEADLHRVAGNHSVLVLDIDVDPTNRLAGNVYMADFDPYRPAGTEAVFKIDKQTFEQKFVPRFAIGVMNVPKASGQ